jgi:hypothetical protein
LRVARCGDQAIAQGIDRKQVCWRGGYFGEAMAFDELKLAHTVRKLFNLTLRGSSQERETARQRLEDLLTKHRLTLGDVDRLIALSVTAPSAFVDNSDDEQPMPPPEGKVPDVFELVDWVLRRFLYLEEDHQFTAFALWVLHTFVFQDFDHTPRLALLSPARGCGKSVGFRLLERLCLRPRKFGSTTTAVLPRLTQERSTVLLDETDNMDFANDPVLRAVLNDGFTTGARRALMLKGGMTEFDLFAPVALAGIGRLPLPLMSRSIVINMARAPRKVKLERFSTSPILLEELDVVYRHVFVWAQTMRGKFDTDPEMPSGFYGRLADRWRVLFSIADALGHGAKARAAARVFASEHNDEDIKVLLLADIRQVFGTDDQIIAENLLKRLLVLDDGQWSEFRGEHGDLAPKPLTRPEMTKMISAFGIRTRTIWPRHRTAETKSDRGYHKGQFEAAWASYCDDTPTQPSAIRHLRRA